VSRLTARSTSSELGGEVTVWSIPNPQRVVNDFGYFLRVCSADPRLDYLHTK
jgi:hypothetical protein